MERLARAGHHGPRAPTGDCLDDRDRGHRHAAGRRRNRACVWNARHRRDDRRGGGGHQRRRPRCGRDDADVRLDHLHDPGRGRAHPGSAALACAVAFCDQYACMAGLATSGTLTHWFADQLARDLSPEAAMGALAAEALASPPGANGLVFLPYFSGERTPIHDPNAKGAIVGLTLAHTRADIYRAALEGIAFATKHIFDTYAEVGAPPAQIVAVGGGLRNRIWTQATSDVSGLKQEAREISIGASYGDAFLARLGLGDVSKSAIKQWNPAAFTIEPDRRSACLYKRRYATFRELYPRIHDLMAELGASDEDSG